MRLPIPEHGQPLRPGDSGMSGPTLGGSHIRPRLTTGEGSYFDTEMPGLPESTSRTAITPQALRHSQWLQLAYTDLSPTGPTSPPADTTGRYPRSHWAKAVFGLPQLHAHWDTACVWAQGLEQAPTRHTAANLL